MGGQFTLEWHRMGAQELCDQLDIEVIYEDPSGTKRWYLPDIQVIYEGAVLAISSLDELLGATQTFFGTRMEHYTDD